ncbi:MAG: DUF3426 domain-containing protein [Methylococcales bacterium]|jgi:predicted Zn finger-like uncharacterized protein|nr:DUF3426 domain-containing protein [Methylococcales bacterium]MBT7410867.1 DUF3426 domain-containing protein [Methylococcales bacterium]
MFTQCPSCDTVFRVSQQHLQMAQGKVRCSSCHGVFNALQNLKQDDSNSVEKRIPSPTPKTQPVKVKNSSVAPTAKNTKTETNKEDAHPAIMMEDILELHDVVDPKTLPHKFNKTDFIWLVGSLVLVFMMMIQVLFILKDELAQKKQWRPLVLQLCDVLQCEVPIQKNIKAIVITQRDIRQNPEHEKSLLINITIKNTADFSQPFPKILMKISKTDSSLMAQRIFLPHEYLGQLSGKYQNMKPNIPIHVVLELVDPGNEATGFQFEFL